MTANAAKAKTSTVGCLNLCLIGKTNSKMAKPNRFGADIEQRHSDEERPIFGYLKRWFGPKPEAQGAPTADPACAKSILEESATAQTAPSPAPAPSGELPSPLHPQEPEPAPQDQDAASVTKPSDRPIRRPRSNVVRMDTWKPRRQKAAAEGLEKTELPKPEVGMFAVPALGRARKVTNVAVASGGKTVVFYTSHQVIQKPPRIREHFVQSTGKEKSCTITTWNIWYVKNYVTIYKNMPSQSDVDAKIQDDKPNLFSSG
jgi:hypothetical protein